MAWQLYELLFPNDKVYFGITSLGVDKRWRGHIYSARGGSKLPVHRAIIKYGEANIIRRILLVGERNFIRSLEIETIKAQKAQNRQFGYNVALGGDVSPMHVPDVAVRAGASYRRFLKENPEYAAGKLAVLLSAESRAKANATIRTPAARAATSAKSKIRGMRQACLDACRTPQALAKLSVSVRAAWADPKLLARHSATLKALPHSSAATRAKISATLMGHPGALKGKENPKNKGRMSNRLWITDGVDNKRLPDDLPLPNGWRYGRRPNKPKD